MMLMFLYLYLINLEQHCPIVPSVIPPKFVQIHTYLSSPANRQKKINIVKHNQLNLFHSSLMNHYRIMPQTAVHRRLMWVTHCCTKLPPVLTTVLVIRCQLYQDFSIMYSAHAAQITSFL